MTEYSLARFLFFHILNIVKMNPRVIDLSLRNPLQTIVFFYKITKGDIIVSKYVSANTGALLDSSLS